MLEQLTALGFSEKEATVYLALLEFGTQPASVIAKKTSFPKATVLFLFDRLFKKGYIQRSQKGRVLYFYADPHDLEQEKQKELDAQQSMLQATLPLLREFKNPFTSPPKLLFFEGMEGCRKAYSLLLESKTPIYEFAAHNDLLKMGEEFMVQFIKERSRRKIFLYAIAQDSQLHSYFHKKDKAQQRNLKLFREEIGNLYSSIDVFENKVLLLNLYQDAFAILIENKEVAETLKTIHHLVSMSEGLVKAS
jgi:sugar-specific transcriptional regulator TrmB